MSRRIAGFHPIYCHRRQRLTETFSVSTDDGLWDFAGMQLEMQIRKSKGGELILDCKDHITVNVPSSSFTLTLPRAVTTEFPEGEWVYDLWVDEFPLLEGPFTVIESVSE